MSILLPSYFQKRLLRYALSRLELLDTDALDLEKLDIAWGRRSTVELKDVGIRLKVRQSSLNNLSALLHLPPSLCLTTAKILLLRVTIPADIYSSSVAVEIEGLIVQARIISDTSSLSTDSPPKPHEAREDETGKPSQGRNTRRHRPAVHDPGGSASGPAVGSGDAVGDVPIPLSVDLAESYLQAEPVEEKAELCEAITSQSAHLQHSTTFLNDRNEDVGTGTGTGLSLPGFLAGFLQGISDRLEVRIQDTRIELDIDIPADKHSKDDSLRGLEPVTIQLHVERITVDGITSRTESTDPKGKRGTEANTQGMPKAKSQREPKRHISLECIRGMLIAEAALFTNPTRLTNSSSPTAKHSSGTNDPRSSESPLTNSFDRSGQKSKDAVQHLVSPVVLSSSEGNQTVHSIVPSDELSPPSKSLEASATTSEGGRFSDAGDEESIRESGQRELFPGFAASHSRESLYDDPTYLDVINQSRFDNEDVENSMVVPNFAVHRSSSLELDKRLGRIDGVPSRRLEAQDSNALSDVDQVSETSVAPSNVLIPFSQTSSNHSISAHFEQEGIADPQSSILQGDQTMEYVPTDNLAFGMGASIRTFEETQDASSESSLLSEDLSQSKLFSHEEAESMYLSAVSQATAKNDGHIAMPGSWDDSSSSRGEAEDRPESHESEQIIPIRDSDIESQLGESPTMNSSCPLHGENGKNSERNATPTQAHQSRYARSDANRSRFLGVPTRDDENMDVQPKTRTKSASSSGAIEDDAKLRKEILHISSVSIDFPLVKIRPSHEIVETAQASATIFPPHSSASIPPDQSSTYPNVPGAFSSCTEHNSAREVKNNLSKHETGIFDSTTTRRIPNQEASYKSSEALIDQEEDNSLEVIIESAFFHFDVAVGRVTAKIIQQIIARLNDSIKATMRQEASSNSRQDTPPITLKIQRVSWKLFDHLTGTSPRHAMGNDFLSSSSKAEVLLRASMDGLDWRLCSTSSATTEFSIRKLLLGYVKENIISFDAALGSRESKGNITSLQNDLCMSVTQVRGIRKINIETLPVRVSLDLPKLDETLVWFGGFSGILELGNSISSDTTITGVVDNSSRRPRTVRFESQRDPGTRHLTIQPSYIKANARIGGVVVSVVGKDCSIDIETTALKLVSREEGKGLVVDKIKIHGPSIRDQIREAPIAAEVGMMRLEYCSRPKETDLARLLSLLMPSRNKYEQDDDILLDTLLRQRRQGALLRMNVAMLTGSVSYIEDLRHIAGLGEEIARLSTVTKYLPQDDRPGILILGMLRSLDLEVNSNAVLGHARLTFSDLHVAHVNLPALTAMGIETVRLHRNEHEELIGDTLSAELHDPQVRSPMIMARMIGDEIEPTIKVKLWNVRVEYNIPTLIALMSLTENPTVEEVMANVSASIATLTDHPQSSQLIPQTSNLSPSNNETYVPSTKSLILNIALRDCAIGLTPRDLPSKGLVVLTDTRFTGAVPRKDVQAVLEMKRASLLIVDDVNNLERKDMLGHTKGHRSLETGSNQVAELCTTGYVSIGYISAARAILRYQRGEEGEKGSLDLELRDELLVLESCADSTQTLIGIINGLTPHVAPSQETKYRTEIIPVSDMLASLSGDAFSTAIVADRDGRSTPLDIDKEDLVGDDVGRNFEFVSSFYTSEQEDLSIKVEHSKLMADLRSSAFEPEACESDEGVIPRKDFHEHYQDTSSVEPLEFKDDYFGTHSVVSKGTTRWDSARNDYGLKKGFSSINSPLKVRVRDVHVIWNLYDGYDWQSTRNTITKAVLDVESKATEWRARGERRGVVDADKDEDSVIDDFLFNSIYIGIPANRNPRELFQQINRNVDDLASETESYTASIASQSPNRHNSSSRNPRKRLHLTRSQRHKMAFELKGVSIDVVLFAPNSGETQSSIDIRVRDFEVFDHVPTSTWKKFATYMQDAGERESGTNMLHLEILTVRPIPDLAASEIVLKATVLPLRLHVDQDALDFVTRFFEFKDNGITVKTSRLEVPFLQRVEVNSVRLKLDYKPKSVDYAGLRSGHTTEFMNFFILDQAEMILRHVIIYGVSGFDRLSRTLNDIWMPDIKHNQLPGILAGLAPVRSLVGVGGGVRDLVVIPIREYRKDGRVIRSMQKGAVAFAKTTTSELAKLGAKLAIGTQTVLQGAEGYLTKPGQLVEGDWDNVGADNDDQKLISLYADQPIGVVQGLRGAFANFERDLVTAKDAIIAVPGEVLDSGSAKDAAKAVLRRAPTVIFRPAIGASKAISQTLLGANNALDPQHRRRVEDKYKKH
ncbi:MAG: autophagy- protein 2 [Pycnora praestabilis]|nr:MAG: autophagy- protein 2 [Pycnora praestabilis]